MAGTLSEFLWNKTEKIRQEILTTYFIQGIGDGSLNPTAFGGYMVQNSVYIYKAKNSIDIARNAADSGPLKIYLGEASRSYEKKSKELFKNWQIENVEGISLNDACQAYADYEKAVASSQETIYLIVAMIPRMKLWQWLGGKLKPGNKGVYKNWYDNNFDADNIEYKKLDAFVDVAVANMTIDRKIALDIYTRCMEGELEFFKAVKNMF
ncbi:uncharacterized protein LOC132556368 [Ylistrum balloti]|uniref:uncharacterized protein LOC132556368 n=1 Tax=Ylistrum balloti TaxID=509963 RepID=UPI002905B320|nr:uncharacterized protein LOC132556368 [Ylistrum balloti]